jgi:hypothetical protein
MGTQATSDYVSFETSLPYTESRSIEYLGEKDGQRSYWTGA